MCFGIFVGAYDLEQEKGYSAPVLLLLIVMLFIIGALNILDESRSSIINTYCTKYYGNNVSKYNDCKYKHTENFSKVINKGI